MKRVISILSVFTLLFLILACNEDNLVEPVSPQADEQSSSLSKFITRLNFTGTESLDAVSDPSRILDPGTVVPMRNKIIIKGFTVLENTTFNVEGIGVTKSQTKVVINAVWDNVTFSGPVGGTFESKTWKGVWKGYRSKIGAGKWLSENKVKGVGIGDFKGMVMKGKQKILSDMPVPLRYTGSFKGQIIFPNPPM